ncbi:hypothetical protein ABIA39_008881 [Nocardia sp. GAS34]|uniref:hypothetical protein n=1 Tax=unclassified Nocardia TaxID=2637762 RepID=UPI003D1917D4
MTPHDSSIGGPLLWPTSERWPHCDAVERTVPFGMLTQTLVILWYPSYYDMLAKLRRTLIAAQYCADLPGDPTPEQIHTIRLAWANTVA